ncbi:MAG: MAPEG family protein [Pseudomonadota bacterium]|nr:MAPEG family protein [Pseudomonadota bacterium]
MSQELFWLATTTFLTGLMPLPYVLDRILVRGLMGTMANPSPDAKPQSAWAVRAQLAHANAIENLCVFAPAVLLVELLGRNTSVAGAACAVYFWARLIHYVVFSAGVPVIRTVAFLVGWAATMIVLAVATGVIA